MKLRGYRQADEALLNGPWPSGELLGMRCADRPALAEVTRIPPPSRNNAQVCVIPGVAVVRFGDLDWVSRRTRLEIGFLTRAGDSAADVLRVALGHAFDVLNLRRVYGWSTPAMRINDENLSAAGMHREAVVPDSFWVDGRAVEREIWGAVA